MESVSQDHRIVKVGRGLSRGYLAQAPLQEEHPEQGHQDCVQAVFENLQAGKYSLYLSYSMFEICSSQSTPGDLLLLFLAFFQLPWSSLGPLVQHKDRSSGELLLFAQPVGFQELLE